MRYNLQIWFTIFSFSYCDFMTIVEGIVSIEERMLDVKKRHEYCLQEKWERNIELKKYVESKTGISLS